MLKKKNQEICLFYLLFLSFWLHVPFIIYSGVEEADELSEEEIALASGSNKSNKIGSDEEE